MRLDWLTAMIWGATLGAVLGAGVGLVEWAFAFPLADRTPSDASGAYRQVVGFLTVVGLLGGVGVAVIARAVTRGEGPAYRRWVATLLVAGLTSGYGLVAGVLAPGGVLDLIPQPLLMAAAGGVPWLAAFFWLRRRGSAPVSARARSPRAEIVVGLALLLALLGVGPLLLGAKGPEPARTPATGEPAGSRPDIIAVVIDTLRADHLPMYGYSRNTSPRIAAFAETGVTFLHASSSSSWTKPSVATLFSALYPAAHRARADEEMLSESVTTLAEVLRDEGYRTFGVTANPLLSPTFGMTQGFDRFEMSEQVSPFRITLAGRAALRLSKWVRTPAVQAPRARQGGQEAPSGDAVEPGPGAATSALRAALRGVLHGTAEAVFGEQVGALPAGDVVTDRAIELARQATGNEPLFLYVHYVDPHVPYVPPPPFDTAFDYGDDRPTRYGVEPRDAAGPGGDRQWIERNVDLYDGEILFVDGQVGRLFDALEAMGRMQGSVVLVTSDHGEEFLDHGGFGHGKTLFQEVVHIPMMMRWPGQPAAGTRSQVPVGLVDLMPTLLAAVDIAPPENVQGRSFLPDLTLPGGPRPYFAELGSLEMVRIGSLKLIRRRSDGQDERLYDLAADPRERDEAGARFTAELKDLREALDEQGEATERLDLGIRPKAAPHREEALEALRRLGYIE